MDEDLKHLLQGLFYWKTFLQGVYVEVFILEFEDGFLETNLEERLQGLLEGVIFILTLFVVFSDQEYAANAFSSDVQDILEVSLLRKQGLRINQVEEAEVIDVVEDSVILANLPQNREVFSDDIECLQIAFDDYLQVVEVLLQSHQCLPKTSLTLSLKVSHYLHLGLNLRQHVEQLVHNEVPLVQVAEKSLGRDENFEQKKLIQKGNVLADLELLEEIVETEDSLGGEFALGSTLTHRENQLEHLGFVLDVRLAYVLKQNRAEVFDLVFGELFDETFFEDNLAVFLNIWRHSLGSN